MRIAFFHSHKFRYTDKGIASLGGLRQEILSKYISENDEIYVYARIIKAQSTMNLSYITDKRIHIVAYNTVSIKQEIMKADFCIARLPSFIAIIACKIARKLNKKYLVEVVGCAWDAYWNHGFKGKLVAPFFEFFMRRTVKKAKYVVYVTQVYLQKKYPNKNYTLGISDVLIPKASKSVRDKRLNKINGCNENKKIIIGTVGAVNVRYKAQEIIIKALGVLRKQGFCNYEYRLVGGGDPEYLMNVAKQSGVEDQVVFLGGVPHEKIFDFYDDIDIYCQPSLLEGLCRSILEAEARGCPVFASNVGENSEIIDSKFLFKHGKNTVQRVVELIKIFTKETMLEQAQINFITADKYDMEILNSKWQSFYNYFKIGKEKKMKVLHVLSALNGGGVENSLLNYYKYLFNDIQFDFVVFGKNEGILETEFRQMGSTIFHVTPKRDGFFEYLQQLKEILKKNEYDFVHCHQAEKGWPVYRLAKKYGKAKCIMHSHGCKDNAGTFEKWKKYIFMRLCKKYVDIFCACSMASARYTYGKKYEQALIIYNVFDINRFVFSLENRVQIRKELNIKDTEKVIGMIGRLSPEKNHAFLLNVFKELHNKGKKYKLLIVGDGQLKTSLQEQCKEKNIENDVIFVGNKWDIHRYYSAMDIFALPSIHEGFGMALVEAQIAGLNAVVSDVITEEAIVLKEKVKKLDISELRPWVESIDAFKCNEREVNLDCFKKFDASFAYKNLLCLYKG